MRAPALALALAALGAWHLVLRGHGAGVPLITDEGEYAAAARAWSEGGLPYRDAFSQKPPVAFLFYRAAAAVSDEPLAPRGAAALAALAALALLASCAPRDWTTEGRLAAPAAFAALAALPVGDYSFPANTETFVNLFACAAAAALLRGAPIAAGLAAGLALTSKQTALWTLAGFGAFAAWGARGLDARRAARFAAGAAAAPLAWAAYFAARGAFGDYWDSAWAGNARYAAALLMTGALGGQLAWFARTLAPRLLAFAAPALAAAGWGLRGLRAGPSRPVETLAVLWLGGAAAGTLTGLWLFPHYFLVVAPPLALAAACGVERLRDARARRAALVLLAAWPALLAPRLIFAATPRERALTLLYPNPLFETKLLGEELARRAAPDDRLHVFGSEGALFSYSGLRPATRHTLSYALTLFGRDAAVDAELAALRAAPPRWLAWSNQEFSTLIATRAGQRYRDELRALASARYRPVAFAAVEPATAPARLSPPGPTPWNPGAPPGVYLFERNP